MTSCKNEPMFSKIRQGSMLKGKQGSKCSLLSTLNCQLLKTNRKRSSAGLLTKKLSLSHAAQRDIESLTLLIH